MTDLRKFRWPLAIAALLLIGAGMTWVSWQRWPDTLIDYGREVYYPWQIAEGQVLYRDLWHFFGPLSHYWNAFLFKIFGVHILTLQLFNLGLTALVCALLFFLVLEAADFLTGFTAAASFLFVFAFSQYIECGNFNFISPYNHEIVHAFTLSLIALWAFRLQQKRRSDRLLGVIGLAAGCVAMAKIEILAALLAALGAGFFLQWREEKFPPKIIVRKTALLAGTFLLPGLGFLVYFSSKMPFSQAVDSILYPYTILFDTHITSAPYYRWVTGMDHPRANLLKLVQSLRWYILVVAGFYALGAALKRIRTPALRTRAEIVLLILAALGCLPLSQISWWNIFRPLPVLLAAVLAARTLDFLRRKNETETPLLVFRISLSVFAMMLLWKMGLNAHLFHYGFVLALPAALLLEAELLYFIPRALSQRFGSGNWSRAAGLLLIATGVYWYVHFCLDIYRHRTFAMGTGADRILEITPRPSRQELILARMIEKIGEVVPPGQTLASLPTGTLVNFWTKHRNPTPYPDLSAMMVDTIGEEKILEAFQAAPPDFITLLDMDTSDGHGGPGSLGQDYAFKLFQWILAQYQPIYQIRPPDNRGYGIVLLKKRPV